MPSLTLATLNDARGRRDTPADTVENLDLAAVERQFEAADETVRRAIFDVAGFNAGGAFVRRRHRVEGQVLALAPGKPVPDLPRPGFLAVMYHGTHADGSPTPSFDWRAKWTLGVRRTEIVASDAEGGYRFEGLDTLGDRNLRYRVVRVYKAEPGTGAIVAASDAGRAGGDFTPQIDLDRGTIRPLKSQTFRCEEFALTGLFDPRFLQDLGTLLPRDARRNAEPQRHHFLLHQAMLAAFVEPGTRNYLLFRYGQIGNRLALLNVPPPEETGGDRLAAGFTTPELRNLGPLSLRTARDFWNLDSRRLDSYAAAGVSSSLLDDLHDSAAEQIGAAEAALEADDGRAFQRNADGAWATEALVYSAAQAMANDVVRAAIFLLLLCVPFAFCMERLAIATTNVYRQIVGAVLIFAGMTAALWAFHPAFRISSSALVIILAFAILFMSGLVIWVVYSRFDTELKKVRRGTAAGESGAGATGGFARAGVVGQAVMLGIANMRRRKFRTLLTSATIVLVTFAVLAFTSSTTYTSVTALPTGEQSDYPGVMLRQRGYRAVPDQLAAGVRSVGEAAFPGRVVVPRWWNVSNGDENFALYLQSTAADGSVRTTPQRGAVGVSPGEGELTPLAAVMGEAAAARLQEPDARVVVLPAPVAAELGVAVGDAVTVGGYALEVVGTFGRRRLRRPHGLDQRRADRPARRQQRPARRRRDAADGHERNVARPLRRRGGGRGGRELQPPVERQLLPRARRRRPATCPRRRCAA